MTVILGFFLSQNYQTGKISPSTFWKTIILIFFYIKKRKKGEKRELLSFYIFKFIHKIIIVITDVLNLDEIINKIFILFIFFPAQFPKKIFCSLTSHYKFHPTFEFLIFF